MPCFPLMSGCALKHDWHSSRWRKEKKNVPCTSSASMSSSLSVGSGVFTNHHWISKYTDAVPLWNAHAISMFCPSLTVMLEGRSVKRPADERGDRGGRGCIGGGGGIIALMIGSWLQSVMTVWRGSAVTAAVVFEPSALIEVHSSF